MDSNSGDRRRVPKSNNSNVAPNKNFVHRKRRPHKPVEGKNLIYVSTKTNTNALLEKCAKLIGGDEPEIVLYCLGAAIQRGILLALKVCEQHTIYKLHANTFTTELIDDLEPAADDADYEIQRRYNSALKIKIIRTDPLKTTAQPSSPPIN